MSGRKTLFFAPIVISRRLVFISLRRIQTQSLTPSNLLLFTHGKILDFLIDRVLVDNHTSCADLSLLIGGFGIRIGFHLRISSIGFGFLSFLLCRLAIPASWRTARP